MALAFDSQAIPKLQFGATEVRKMYFADTLAYEAGSAAAAGYVQLTLPANRYRANNNARRWIFPSNNYLSIPAALVNGTGDLYLRVVNFNRGRLYLNFSDSPSVENNNGRLVDDFATQGQLLVVNGSDRLLIQIADPNVTFEDGRTQDPYGLVFSGDAMTAERAFYNTLGSTNSSQAAELHIWDGNGSNPFPST